MDLIYKRCEHEVLDKETRARLSNYLIAFETPKYQYSVLIKQQTKTLWQRKSINQPNEFKVPSEKLHLEKLQKDTSIQLPHCFTQHNDSITFSMILLSLLINDFLSKRRYQKRFITNTKLS